jgi:hypothetical protein
MFWFRAAVAKIADFSLLNVIVRTMGEERSKGDEWMIGDKRG